MALDRLLEGWAEAPSTPVEALTLDSREVREGTAFVALAGASTHGLRHAQAANERGAVAVLFEPPAPEGLDVPDNATAVPDLRRRLGAMADRFYSAPSETLRVIGVTGTNGKTSTVQLVTQALHRAGEISGSIGTLGAGLHGQIAAGERTTPDVIRVHALLAAMRDAGAQNVAMEVSSHALDQGRVNGVRFDIGVFTNLTRDHLDYHGTMEAYGAAKARLFDWPGLEAAVVNLDDEFGRTLFASIPKGVHRIGVSSRGVAELWADKIALGAADIAFELVEGVNREPVRSALLGRFNVDNLLAVAGVLRAIGWPLKQVADALEELDPVPGRMARLGGDAHMPLVVVDYAHTPDALEQALSSLRGHTAGRLVCVFGCGGERDRGKRPQMAALAERGADAVIVTDDNPRRENGDVIVADILAGFANPVRVQVQRDRAQAIALALREARPGDTVLIAGKGHEPYQEIDGVKHPFDDLDVARHLLAARDVAGSASGRRDGTFGARNDA
jgi:UDP-N-acetylmuramoyl-L-alanyl-D-glutamate--2,6-diaminopimelate ligase